MEVDEEGACKKVFQEALLVRGVSKCGAGLARGGGRFSAKGGDHVGSGLCKELEG